MVPNNQRPILLSQDCPVRQILDIVGDKWTPPILYILRSGTTRYGEFQRQIPGVSKKMLTQTLRQLESNGILHNWSISEASSTSYITLHSKFRCKQKYE